ncbi:LOW QUALITY PROTEIN: thioredoxin reductase 1, cytoplasmic-like [Tachypleus tridentatus]|uniref:LOW QUALITY PROTEIN: thioredoxin reductase 1, cytoplasmic-like n=1 Tax=Tachypleus tridentatus TaxID=6853 RepID=UPI003FD16454
MAPVINHGENVKLLIERHVKDNQVMLFSKSYCGFCRQVKKIFQSLDTPYFSLELDELGNGSDIQAELTAQTGRTTVPQVFINGVYLGGCDDTHAAYSSGKLAQLLRPTDEQYEYDLIVIGGGSGGLAASKEAAKLGKKVAVFDFVTPTPKGTTWGLGGTCVNVGCIPKKLMHRAAILGESLEEAKKFGWDVPDYIQHSWNKMTEEIQSYIGSLNWGYRVALREKQVKYFNARAEFVEEHKIKAIDKRKKESFHTAKHFIIATGERPRYPNCPGAKEYGITSDDLFSLPHCPGKTLLIGASYVSLECAGFLKGIGLDVTVMVRSILLRGFDQNIAERIGSHMSEHCGIKFIRPCVPTKVEEIEPGQPGKLRVTGKMVDSEEIVEDYDTVIFAIGRDACTSGIGLDVAGVQVNTKNGKIPTVTEQTNIPHIYAIGDILDGKLELTPVAIEAGILLARRLYGNGELQCDYLNVPTTVFTPLEYGCIGYPEEQAIQKYGDENIEVYHTNFLPLEWTLPKKSENVCYAKLICLKTENERVIGFHYLGPNAGEVTQGFAVGIKKGATKADFDATIGIHPTCAEVFTTLSVTRRSGKSIKQKGC